VILFALNVHAPTEDKSYDTGESLYEELEGNSINSRSTTRKFS